MSVAPLSAAQLHEPILPLVKPAHVVLHPDHTIAQTLDRIRASVNARSSASGASGTTPMSRTSQLSRVSIP